jgi:hypothetical protein
MGPFIRIGLRAVGWFLVGKGWASEQDVHSALADPELELAIGAVLAAIPEAWYALAKRYGWRT